MKVTSAFTTTIIGTSEVHKGFVTDIDQHQPPDMYTFLLRLLLWY